MRHKMLRLLLKVLLCSLIVIENEVIKKSLALSKKLCARDY